MTADGEKSLGILFRGVHVRPRWICSVYAIKGFHALPMETVSLGQMYLLFVSALGIFLTS